MRFTNKPVKILQAMMLAFLLAGHSAYAQESNAELLEKLEFLQEQIDELKQKLEQTENKGIETNGSTVTD